MGNLFNNAQSAVLFSMYWELTESTIESVNGQYQRAESTLTPIIILPVVLLGVGEYVLWDVHFLWHGLFGLISGIGGGITIALLVGRLDSRRISPPRYVVGLLYLYALIQPLFPWLEPTSPYLALSMFSLALVLKVILFLFVYWTFASGKLLYYCVRMTELLDGAEQDFDQFVREHVVSGIEPLPGPLPNAAAAITLVPSAPDPQSAQRRVFLAVPMSSLDPDAVPMVRIAAKQLEAEIRKHGFEVYCAANLEPPWGPPDQALARTESELRSADVFVLVYPRMLATSALVETGMAIALVKRCIVFVRNQVELPFLLQGLGHPPKSRVERFANYDELSGKISKHWASLVDEPSASSAAAQDTRPRALPA
jgi:hypothetical protein